MMTNEEKIYLIENKMDTLYLKLDIVSDIEEKEQIVEQLDFLETQLMELTTHVQG